MSPVFVLAKREEIKLKLLDAGISYLHKKGIRKMTIDDVVAMAGIGKGTFYHFYDSKELFIYEVIQYSKDNIYQTLNQIIDERGGINKEAMLELFHKFSFYSGTNIINTITAEDEQWLKSKLPPEYTLNPPKEEELIALLQKHMIHTRSDINPHILANMMKIMAITVENKQFLHQDVLEENLKMMELEICNYIFEKEG